MTNLKVLTLNTWGAPYARDHSARFRLIGEEVKRISPDLVAFQEVYSKNQRNTLVKTLNKELPYHHYFQSGVIGSGLLTFSRYPVLNAQFLRFRLSGKPERLKHGDYYAGKGIGVLRVQTPTGIVDFYNSHTHAQYEPAPDNEYAAYNASNLFEAARFIQSYSQDTPGILCGDLNSEPHQLGYRLITRLSALRDLYAETHPGDAGYTFLATNPYTQEHNQRLDYILTRDTHERIWQAQTISVGMNNTLDPTTGAQAYSDHCAVIAVLQLIETPQQTRSEEKKQKETCGPIIQELRRLIEHELDSTYAAQASFTDRALFSIVAFVDADYLLGKASLVLPAIRQRRHLLRGVALIGGMVFAATAFAHAQINLRARINALESTLQELHWLIRSDDMTPE